MKEKRKDRTISEILDAAKGIVHQDGHEAVTVRHLAERTGYTHTNLYYYFKDLESFLWSLRMAMIEDMIDELQSAPQRENDPVDDVIMAFFRYTNYFIDHPNVFRFFYFHSFIQPEHDDRFQALEQRLQGTWQTTFHRLIQLGVVRAEDLDTVARTIIYAVQGMLLLRLSSNGPEKQQDINQELTGMIRFTLSKTETCH